MKIENLCSGRQRSPFFPECVQTQNIGLFVRAEKCALCTVGPMRRETHRDGPTKCSARARTSLSAKRAEEALQQTQIYLREGQRLARIGSWAFQEAGLYWSDELYQIFWPGPGERGPRDWAVSDPHSPTRPGLDG